MATPPKNLKEKEQEIGDVLVTGNPAAVKEKGHAVDQEVETDPTFLGKLAAFMNKSGIKKTVGMNTSSIVLAGQIAGGVAVLETIRERLVRPMLPDNMREMLDNKIVVSLLDIAIANLFSVGISTFESQIPDGNIKTFLIRSSDAAVNAAWVNSVGKFNVPELIERLFTPELISQFLGDRK